MKEKRVCKVIQDLLPNYIENLTTEETNTYIAEHLQECNNCKEILENMQKELNTNTNKRDNREVNYIKKFSNKMKILKFILLIIFIMFALIIGRRIIIVTQLANNAEDIRMNNENNYYAKIEGIFAGEYNITECYYKDGNYIIKRTSYSKDEGEKELIFYKNGTEHIMLTDSKQGKFINRDAFLTEIVTLPRYEDKEALSMALAYGVEKVKLGDIECYVLKDKGFEQYIDKNTGLLVKQIDRQNNTITDYKYEFGIVEDIDLKLPDISEYTSTDNKEETPKEDTYSTTYEYEKYKNLPISYLNTTSYAYRTDTPERAMGVADYAFVAKVNGILRTEYRFPTTVYRDGVATVVYDPYTVFSVEVIQNIKGEIIKTKNIEVLQHGGITSDGSQIELLEGMELLNVGETYILLPYTASDGRLGISNPTSIIHLGNATRRDKIIETYIKAGENAIIPEGKTVVKSEIYDVDLVD